MSYDSSQIRQLEILEQIEANPDLTQADMATQVGVAIGTVNWHVKRLLKKGYVKVTRLQGRRVRYLITPEGIAEKSRLTVRYLQSSMQLYRQVREQSRALLGQVRQAGHRQVVIEGDGDIADVCRLTCLEQHIEVVTPDEAGPETPVVTIAGKCVTLKGVVDSEWPHRPETG